MQTTNQGDERKPDPQEGRLANAVQVLEAWWEMKAEEFQIRFNSFVTQQSGRTSIKGDRRAVGLDGFHQSDLNES